MKIIPWNTSSLENNFGRITQVMGLAFFGFLFYLSLSFYKERMINFDPAFFSFLIVNSKNFFFPLGRWGSFFSQIIPVMSLKYGVSLRTFLLIYSSSFILVHYLIFLIITLRFKNYIIALAQMLALCLMFRHAFYYATAELYQGLSFTMLLWAFVSSSSWTASLWKKRMYFFIAFLFIIFISFLHQLTLFLVVFVLLFELFWNKKYTDKYLIALIILTFLWYFLRIKIFTTTLYENEKLPTLALFLEKIKSLKHLPAYVYFKQFFKRSLWVLFGTMLVFIPLMFLKRRMIPALLLILFPLILLLLVFITLYKGDSPLMYENYFAIVGFFPAVALMRFTNDQYSKKTVLILFAFLTLTSLKGVYNGHYTLSKRIAYLDRLNQYAEKHQKDKYLLYNSTIPWNIAWLTWSFPFETFANSSVSPGHKSSTFYVIGDDQLKVDSIKNKNGVFMGPNWCIEWFQTFSLEKNYYNLSDSGYAYLNTSQADTSFNEAAFNKNNIHLTCMDSCYFNDADTFLIIPVHFLNTSGRLLRSIPAGPNPVYVSYHIYKENETAIYSEGQRTALEVDIGDEYTQGVNVSMPHQPGHYMVDFDMVSDGKRWWSVNARTKLVVRRRFWI